MVPPPIPSAALDHVALRVADIERSARFYRDGLGLAIESRFELGGRRFAHLLAPGGGRVELVQALVESGPVSEAAVIWHFALATEDVRSSLAAALAAGGVVAVPLTDLSILDDATGVSRRVRIAFVRGPDAEEVELVEELPPRPAGIAR